MIPDLATLRRRAYAEQHPDRDTRAMQCSDDVLALEAATSQEFSRLEKRLAKVEAKLRTGDE